MKLANFIAGVTAVAGFIGISKGLIAIVLGRFFHLPRAELALIGFITVLGHAFPVYFQFRGGKGVATFLGVLLCHSFRWLRILRPYATTLCYPPLEWPTRKR